MVVALLFDLDGTLVRGAGAGARAMRDAVRQWLGGQEEIPAPDTAGQTDLYLFRDLLARAGVSYEAPPPDLIELYVERLREEVSRARGRCSRRAGRAGTQPWRRAFSPCLGYGEHRGRRPHQAGSPRLKPVFPRRGLRKRQRGPGRAGGHRAGTSKAAGGGWSPSGRRHRGHAPGRGRGPGQRAAVRRGSYRIVFRRGLGRGGGGMGISRLKRRRRVFPRRSRLPVRPEDATP